MLASFALIFLTGMALGVAFTRLKLPGLLGMLVAGILLGPYALNLIDGAVLGISADLRQLALIIILLRAGLSLNLSDLKKVGRPAALMCFVPACCEIAAMVLLAPGILGVSRLEAAIMGSVVAAVSPAVIVPRMIKLIDEGYGTSQGIPQMIMAGASVDDVFVLVLFTAFTSLTTGGSMSAMKLAEVPISIALGLVAGLLVGRLLSLFLLKTRIRDSAKTIVLLSIACLLVALESITAQAIPFSGLLAVMAAGMAVLRFSPALAQRMSAKLSKLWVAAEILLFALVGATVDVRFAVAAGGKTVLLLLGALAFRMVGVLLCLLGTSLSRKERLFCMIAYTPKATVQAAIGGIPLAMGLACGNAVLTVAVLSILITAPLGALGVDITYRRWLSKDLQQL